jgi:hypothetical protein
MTADASCAQKATRENARTTPDQEARSGTHDFSAAQSSLVCYAQHLAEVALEIIGQCDRLDTKKEPETRK